MDDWFLPNPASPITKKFLEPFQDWSESTLQEGIDSSDWSFVHEMDGSHTANEVKEEVQVAKRDEKIGEIQEISESPPKPHYTQPSIQPTSHHHHRHFGLKVKDSALNDSPSEPNRQLRATNSMPILPVAHKRKQSYSLLDPGDLCFAQGVSNLKEEENSVFSKRQERPEVVEPEPAIGEVQQAASVLAQFYGMDPQQLHWFAQTQGHRPLNPQLLKSRFPSCDTISSAASEEDDHDLQPFHFKPLERRSTVGSSNAEFLQNLSRSSSPVSQAHHQPELFLHHDREFLSSIEGLTLRNAKNCEKHVGLHFAANVSDCACCDSDHSNHQQFEPHRSFGDDMMFAPAHPVEIEERKFLCEECGKRYKQKSHLIVHKRTHEGVKPFPCHVEGCTKSFVTNSALRAHLRVHSGERPYVCGFSDCGRLFSTNSNLRRHERTHSSSVAKFSA